MSSLGQLVAGVAHEINNPVSFIYGNLFPATDYMEDILGLMQLYQQHYPEPPSEIEKEIERIELDFVVEDLPRLFNSMKIGADRIRDLVKSLRIFSRLDESDLKEVELHENIDSTVMILQSRFKEKANIPAIELVKQYGKLPKVECYPGQLNQVFMHLIANAIDALEARDKKRSFEEIVANPSTCWIKTQLVNNKAVQIRIADNGIGISSDALSKIFDPFYTTKAVGSGTGLGLSISYQVVVEKHGGCLRCISEEGVGTEFVIEIPLTIKN
jgi:signal transduction histidine kinase